MSTTMANDDDDDNDDRPTDVRRTFVGHLADVCQTFVGRPSEVGSVGRPSDAIFGYSVLEAAR